jgi:hypothetical protein
MAAQKSVKQPITQPIVYHSPIVFRIRDLLRIEQPSSWAIGIMRSGEAISPKQRKG